ncbi:DUF3078 domain-containing protein [Marivirga atlantica]|jgi:hypothetical protein|uniref:DUF3078 domain-containing protein n=1 Tax=Marivirga atlantica TaxID=1548457 RepID=A0A937DE16_9BACT|nr:DUF3078 domain-containing protein [Marivirga atlantica]MBL0764792.1 DUF3078 domain-containing protein [Marivirga atlantica]
MKKLSLIVAIIFSVLQLKAQNDTIPADTSYWTKEAVINLNFSQVSLTNWAGGGQSSISITGLTNFKADYEKGKNLWANRLDMAYGILRQGDEDQPFIKTDDNIILTSRYSRKMTQNWFASALVDFRTQFAEGVEEIDGRDSVISKFMAPGFLLANIGITYKYKKIFNATLSPLSSKTTFVLDDSLSSSGAYGVEAGDKYRFQGGVNFASAFNKTIVENVTFSSNLNLFAAYEELAEIDVNWENTLVFKVNKFINATFSTQLIYDEDIKSKEIVVNETTGDTRLAPGVQFKSAIAIGFSLKI